MRREIALLCLIAATAAAHSPDGGKAERDSKGPVDPTDTATDIWKSRCSGCHKKDGSGNAKKKVPDMTSAKWQEKHGDELIRRAILDGVPETKMKSFEGVMTDAQLAAVVQLIRGMKR